VKILPQKISGTLIRVSVYFDIDSYYFCEGVHVLKFESVLALLELAEQLSALLLRQFSHFVANWNLVYEVDKMGNAHFLIELQNSTDSSISESIVSEIKQLNQKTA
jgi:hypothetical protein